MNGATGPKSVSPLACLSGSSGSARGSKLYN